MVEIDDVQIDDLDDEEVEAARDQIIQSGGSE